jgi:hypothetical protein
VKTSTVQLVGGIGNQLFGYFAGQYLEISLGRHLRYLPSSQTKTFFSSRSSLEDLALPGNAKIDNSLTQAVTARIKRKGAELHQNMRGNRISYSKFFSIYNSPEVGFDPMLDNLEPGTLINGYFQSYSYYDSSIDLGHPLVRLKKPSDWFLAMSLLARVDRPVMVHIRRGDYLKHGETIGVLADRYYTQALSTIFNIIGDRPVWLFTDAVDSAQALASLFQGWDTRIIEQPKTSSSAESLMLMSKGAGIITSNSTFSWWAAKIGNIEAVVAPSKWFVSGADPSGLIPQSWHRSDSIWL